MELFEYIDPQVLTPLVLTLIGGLLVAGFASLRVFLTNSSRIEDLKVEQARQVQDLTNKLGQQQTKYIAEIEAMDRRRRDEIRDLEGKQRENREALMAAFTEKYEDLQKRFESFKIVFEEYQEKTVERELRLTDVIERQQTQIGNLQLQVSEQNSLIVNQRKTINALEDEHALDRDGFQKIAERNAALHSQLEALKMLHEEEIKRRDECIKELRAKYEALEKQHLKLKQDFDLSNGHGENDEHQTNDPGKRNPAVLDAGDSGSGAN